MISVKKNLLGVVMSVIWGMIVVGCGDDITIIHENHGDKDYVDSDTTYGESPTDGDEDVLEVDEEIRELELGEVIVGEDIEFTETDEVWNIDSGCMKLVNQVEFDLPVPSRIIKLDDQNFIYVSEDAEDEYIVFSLNGSQIESISKYILNMRHDFIMFDYREGKLIVTLDYPDNGSSYLSYYFYIEGIMYWGGKINIPDCKESGFTICDREDMTPHAGFSGLPLLVYRDYLYIPMEAWATSYDDTRTINERGIIIYDLVESKIVDNWLYSSKECFETNGNLDCECNLEECLDGIGFLGCNAIENKNTHEWFSSCSLGGSIYKIDLSNPLRPVKIDEDEYPSGFIGDPYIYKFCGDKVFMEDIENSGFKIYSRDFKERLGGVECEYNGEICERGFPSGIDCLEEDSVVLSTFNSDSDYRLSFIGVDYTTSTYTSYGTIHHVGWPIINHKDNLLYGICNSDTEERYALCVFDLSECIQ